MFDLQGFYEAKDVADAVQALTANPNAEIISGGMREKHWYPLKISKKLRA